jgi:glucan phosphoethanolaminetransferase (alkaline phosphatase superfamily)
MKQLLRFTRTSKGLYWIVGWRLLFGFVLVISAPLSYYSTFFYVIGTLSLFGGLVTIMMGPRYVEQYLGWWQMRPAVCLRVIMLLGWLLGVTLAFMAFKSL